MARGLLALLLIGCFGGCELPRDADGTLERARGGTLHVGVTEQSPFVVLARDEGRRPSGVEVDLVEGFARSLRARVDYVAAGEEALVEQLEVGELDIVIGGITKASPWKKHAAMTRPFATTHETRAGKWTEQRHVMLTRLGENALLVELERYLLDRESTTRERLRQEGER